MKKSTCFAVALGLISMLVIGCSESGDVGDVEKAKAASAAAPKDISELPSDMSPQARRSAEGAILQMKARDEQANAQAEAMKRARGGN